ncbi:hypothetical protein BH10CHL1_BH10CHL1_42220 [soil metagenome]
MAVGLTLGIIFCLVASLLVLIGMFFFISTRIFIGKAQAVKGSVIQIVYRGRGYAPVYQFRTADGQTIVTQAGLSTNPPRFTVGQVVDVLYETENPQKNRINQWMNLYFLPVLLGGIGLIFGGVGMVFVFLQVLKS